MENEKYDELLKNQLAAEQKMELMNDSVNLIIDAVKGNRLTGKGGMINDIEQTRADIKEIKSRVTELEVTQKKWMFAVTAIISILGILGIVVGMFKK